MTGKPDSCGDHGDHDFHGDQGAILEVSAGARQQLQGGCGLVHYMMEEAAKQYTESMSENVISDQHTFLGRLVKREPRDRLGIDNFKNT